MFLLCGVLRSLMTAEVTCEVSNIETAEPRTVSKETAETKQHGALSSNTSLHDATNSKQWRQSNKNADPAQISSHLCEKPRPCFMRLRITYVPRPPNTSAVPTEGT